MSSSAARSPLIEISSCSLRLATLPNSSPDRRAVQHDAERVLAVGRERVHDRDAAARAPRRAFDVVHLRLGARHLVGRLGRAGVAIAERDASRSSTPRAGSPRAASARRPARRRCCRSRRSSCRAAGTRSRRRRDRAARGSSARTRRDSGAGTSGGRDSGAAPPRCRAASRAPPRASSTLRASGRRAPGGGIMPARSLRIIFSATSACCSTCATSKPARLN